MCSSAKSNVETRRRRCGGCGSFSFHNVTVRWEPYRKRAKVEYTQTWSELNRNGVTDEVAGTNNIEKNNADGTITFAPMPATARRKVSKGATLPFGSSGPATAKRAVSRHRRRRPNGAEPGNDSSSTATTAATAATTSSQTPPDKTEAESPPVTPAGTPVTSLH